MLNNVLGIINVIENEQTLGELTEQRSLAAVPMGGRYRVIDFPLSNMVNAGIKSIGIFTHYKMGSLVSHLKNGREWNLDTKRRGLFFLSPDFSKYLFSPNKWDVSHFTTRLGYIKTSTRNYVLITGCNIICNIDYQKVGKFHQEKGAQITAVYKEILPEEKEKYSPYLSFRISEESRIREVNSTPPPSGKDNMCVEMFFLSRQLLLELIDTCVKQNKWDLVRDGLLGNLRDIKVYGYHFPGYLAKINSLSNYYRHHMDLLQPKVWRELFFAAGPIYTKAKDSVPTKYLADASVQNSLVANDCIIGGKVENSIIFRGVKIGKGAHIKKSIILEKGIIDNYSRVDYALLDKEVRVTKGKEVSGTDDAPVVIRKQNII